MLKTPDFAKAAALLSERGIITGSSDGKVVVLVEGRTTAEIAKILVDANLSLDGIWPQEQTLEDFYLRLVKAAPAAADPR